MEQDYRGFRETREVIKVTKTTGYQRKIKVSEEHDGLQDQNDLDSESDLEVDKDLSNENCSLTKI